MEPKITVTKQPKSKVEIEVEFSAQDFNSFIDHITEESLKEVEIKGFRKGTAPKELALAQLDQQAIMEHAAEHAVEQGYRKAVVDNKLEVIGQPQVDVAKMAKDNPFAFKITVDVLPKFELPDYKAIAKTVKKKELEIKEEEIQDSLKWLQNTMAKLEDKTGKAQKGDWVEIMLTINDNKPNRDAFILGKGRLLPALEEKIEGMEPGQEIEVDFEFPDKKPGHAKIALTQMKLVQMPELSDEFAKTVGSFENLEALKQALTNDLKASKGNQITQEAVDQVLEKTANQVKDLQVPDVLIEREIEETIKDFQKRITDQNITMEEYLAQTKQTMDGLHSQLKPGVEKKIKEYLVLQEIKKQEEIQIGEEELNAEIDKITQNYPDLAKVDLGNLLEYTKERMENQRTIERIDSFIQ